ncbi:RNR1, partial [Symbiodinium necroappetens]
MEEEREALEAVYDTDFEADGSTWRVRLPELNAVLILRLGGGYPESQPPSPSLEFDPWPKGGDAFARRVTQDLLGQFEPGSGCVIQWVEFVKEAWANSPPDAVAAVETEAPAEVVETEAKPSSVALTPELAQAVGPSLLSAGFTEWSPGLFAHSDKGVTAEVREDLSITVDGVDAEDLVDWAGMQLSADPASFGARLLEW